VGGDAVLLRHGLGLRQIQTRQRLMHSDGQTFK
jgi:hypothetical protein